MLPENQLFIVRGEDGQEYGPVDLDELRGWVRENRAGLGTEVRRDGPTMPWGPWQNYPELVALLAEAQAGAAGPISGLAVGPLPRRILAFMLDLILSGLLASPLFYVVKSYSGVPDLEYQFLQMLLQPDAPVSQVVLNYAVINNLISYTVLALYFTGFHAAHGRTPAKSLLRLRVVDMDGEKPGILRAFVRSLVLIGSMCLLFVPLAYAFFNPQRRTLHDLLAGTCVVEA